MRFSPAIFLLCVTLTACTVLQPEKTFVHGSVWTVSQADIHQAIAVVRAVQAEFSQAEVDEVVVTSHDILCIYFHGCRPFYATVRRVEGRWQHVHVEPADMAIIG